MEPFDKFGNQIYPKTYNKMLGYARVLKAHGFTESLKKPNLFYRKDVERVFKQDFEGGVDITQVVFFADMRGTDVVPIWEDSSPLLYARFRDDMLEWQRRRLLEEEYFELAICRFSFYEECGGATVIV
jgi:hypothetical protein